MLRGYTAVALGFPRQHLPTPPTDFVFSRRLLLRLRQPNRYRSSMSNQFYKARTLSPAGQTRKDHTHLVVASAMEHEPTKLFLDR